MSYSIVPRLSSSEAGHVVAELDRLDAAGLDRAWHFTWHEILRLEWNMRWNSKGV